MLEGNRSLGAAFALLPAALLLYLAFNSGGIFGLTTAFLFSKIQRVWALGPTEHP